jgi:hypothetical protein
MSVLFESIRTHGRAYEYPGPSVAALESVLIRLYLESPVGGGAAPPGMPMLGPPVNGQIQMQAPPQNGNIAGSGSVTQTNGNPNGIANTNANGTEDANGDEDEDENAMSDDAE